MTGYDEERAAAAAFGQMIAHGMQIQAEKRQREEHLRAQKEWAERLRAMFAGFSKEEMRVMWDHVGDDSFFGPYDCADIHGYMNLIGDGDYCAV